jgi:ankyrin repeat protein
MSLAVLMYLDLDRREMAMVLRQLVQVCPPGFADKADGFGWYPLHIVANCTDEHRVRPGMVVTLVKAQADVNKTKKRGMTPLMCAVSTGHISCADILLLQGADPNQENEEGVSMYDMAWHNKHMQDWVSALGVGEGAGVSGSGRLYLNVRSAISQCFLSW